MFKFAPQTAFNNDLFTKTKVRYEESQRYYHTLTHIENLLALFEQYQDKITDPTTVYFAIWFHDLVYNPTRNDNEEQSAKLAENYLQQLFSIVENDEKNDESRNNKIYVNILKISRYILATKTHSNTEKDTNSQQDLQWFLDFDLSVLGSDNHSYNLYAKNIRKEYIHVPFWKYSIGRRKVLKHLLGKEKLFGLLPPIYEKQARQNMQEEYKSLRWKFWE
jgi:predicted metal-dependent HD superfamily phosphohydrolase